MKIFGGDNLKKKRKELEEADEALDAALLENEKESKASTETRMVLMETMATRTRSRAKASSSFLRAVEAEEVKEAEEARKSVLNRPDDAQERPAIGPVLRGA